MHVERNACIVDNIVKSQLLFMWPRNVAQVELSLSNGVGLPLTHYFSVMSENITINHYIEILFFGLRSCRRQYGYNFTHCDVIGPKASAFCEITAITPFEVVHGHHFRHQSKACMRLAMCEIRPTMYLAQFPSGLIFAVDVVCIALV